jgi:hypothetical protein
MREYLNAWEERALIDLLVLLSFLVVFGVIFFRQRLPEWLRSVRAEGWRLTQGSVETGDVTVMRTTIDGNLRFLRRPELARASLGYSYQFDGAFYSGHYSKAFVDEQKAWDFVHEWKGQSVMVRSHPAKPDVSVLRLKDQLSSPQLAFHR